MLVDMHVHTNTSSPCAFMDPASMIEWAASMGLDAVCVTEHDEVEGAQAAYEMGLRRGFRVFRGVEIYTDLGDMLVFGHLADARSLQVPYRELLAEAHAAGGIVIPAHPCRGLRDLHAILGEEEAEELLTTCDALEVFNGGTARENNAIALAAAVRYGLPGVGGSDAHHLVQIGRCLTEFERDLEDEDDLVAEVKAGRCRALYAEEAPSLRWPGSRGL